MDSKILFQTYPANSESLAFKRIMADAIEDWGGSKKALAIELGISQSDLSHYLSVKCGYTLPAHLIVPFCEVTGNWELIRFFQRRYANRARRGRVA